MEKRLLIVVDYQRDFVSGALGFPGAEKLEPILTEKINAYHSRGDQVVFTYDTHGEDYLATQEGKGLPVPHCIQGTPGWELFGGIGGLMREGDRCFYKPAFGSGELFDYLRAGDYTSVELAGLVSNICVLSQAVLAKTALPEAQILVDATATASFDPVLHQAALQVMEGLQIQILHWNRDTAEQEA